MGIKVRGGVPIALDSVGKAMPYVITAAVCLSMIAMGGHYVNSCPVEVLIPVYLITMGVASLVRLAVSIATRVKDWGETGAKVNRLTRVADVILFIWLLVGSVTIYSTEDEFQSHNATADDFCNETLYWYSYWTNTITMVVLAVCALFAGGVVYYTSEMKRLRSVAADTAARFSELGISNSPSTQSTARSLLPFVSNMGIVVILAVPISMVVMGAIHHDDCPAENKIHIYLIVMGLVAGLRLGISLLLRCCDPDDLEDVSLITAGLSVLVLGCFITGCVFIYRVKDDFQSHNATAHDFCDYTFYWYSFWINTSGFIFMLIAAGYIAVLCLFF